MYVYIYHIYFVFSRWINIVWNQTSIRYRCHYCKNIYMYCSIWKLVAVSVAAKYLYYCWSFYIFMPILLEILDTCKLKGPINRFSIGLKSRSIIIVEIFILVFLLGVSGNIGSKHLEQFRRGIINWYFEMNTVRHLLNNSRVVAIVSVFNIYFAGVIDSHGFHRSSVLTSQLNQTN